MPFVNLVLNILNREREMVAVMAEKAAGVDHVVNDLQVAPPES
jgi:osmotically-inducible protein OsmY